MLLLSMDKNKFQSDFVKLFNDVKEVFFSSEEKTVETKKRIVPLKFNIFYYELKQDKIKNIKFPTNQLIEFANTNSSIIDTNIFSTIMNHTKKYNILNESIKIFKSNS